MHRGWQNAGMPHVYRCPMRWRDLNAADHVDHCVIVDYLQEARVDLLCDQPDPVGSMLAAGVLVTAHQVEYRAQLFAGPDPLRIEVWVDAVGGSRFSISYRLFDDSAAGSPMVARARTFAAPYDLAAGALRRLTEAERAQLRAGTEPAEEFPAVAKALPTGSGVPAERTGLHVADAQVRWSELDAYGHVNNTRFFDYLSEARNRLLCQAFGLDPRSPEVTTVGWVIARQDVDYLAPIDFRRTPYEVRTAVLDVGTSSARLVAEIRDPATGRRFARAGTVLVGVDPVTGRSRPWTDVQRSGLAAFRL